MIQSDIKFITDNIVPTFKTRILGNTTKSINSLVQCGTNIYFLKYPNNCDCIEGWWVQGKYRLVSKTVVKILKNENFKEQRSQRV